jgi:hypothetical protein
MTDAEYMVKELNELVGYKITGTVITEDKESFGLVLEKDAVPGQSPRSRKTAWIDRDPECNGPGWVSIQEHPYEKSTPSG